MKHKDRHTRAKESLLRQKVETAFYKDKTNRRLILACLLPIVIAILLMLAMIIWMDSISPRAMLFMAGCTGLLAIISVIMAAIIFFRLNTAYWQEKNNNL